MDRNRNPRHAHPMRHDVVAVGPKGGLRCHMLEEVRLDAKVYWALLENKSPTAQHLRADFLN